MEELKETSKENKDYFGLEIPNKLWFTLAECCKLKNLNYRTACNRTYLQPNRGKTKQKIGGRKIFRRDVVLEWLFLTDDQICKEKA